MFPLTADKVQERLFRKNQWLFREEITAAAFPLRFCIHIKVRLYKKKKKNVSGQLHFQRTLWYKGDISNRDLNTEERVIKTSPDRLQLLSKQPGCTKSPFVSQKLCHERRADATVPVEECQGQALHVFEGWWQRGACVILVDASSHQNLKVQGQGNRTRSDGCSVLL